MREAQGVKWLAELWARVTRAELVVAAAVALVLAGLVAAEPDILRAPFQNERTLTFTFGGTLLAAVVLVLLLSLRVWPAVRIVVLGVPFVVVSWWLLSPYFVDDVVNEDFGTTIAAASDAETSGDAVTTTVPAPPAPDETTPGATVPDRAPPTTTVAPAGPRLLGAGQFVGLAGHHGTGDAGLFALDDGASVLRLENLDIDNGPDLRLYLVPGRDERSPSDASIYLGKLRGNVGNQTYELTSGFAPLPAEWTVLVWCEAFDVEFVAANITIS